eukprot:3179760-Pleurochrysis_carterae.AAC.2
MKIALNPTDMYHKLHASRRAVDDAREGEAGGVHDGGEQGGDTGGAHDGGGRASGVSREPGSAAASWTRVGVGEGTPTRESGAARDAK